MENKDQQTNLQRLPESLPLKKILFEQPNKDATRLFLSGLLIRLAEIYGLQNFGSTHSLMMADWIMENYKYDTLSIVVDTLKNPPALEEKVWRINPDTIREWMAISLDRLAEKREIFLHNKKMDGKAFDPDYESFKKRLDEERIKAKEKSASDREKRIFELSDMKKYQSTPEEVAIKALKIEWSKEFHDLHTGKKNPNWISFDEWLKTE